MNPLFERVKNHEISNDVVSAIKDIFREIGQSKQPIETYKYVFKLHLPYYQAKEQYDSHECLTDLLNKIYPSLVTVDAFKLQIFESIVCHNSGCTYNSEGILNDATLTLKVQRTFAKQSIGEIINRSLLTYVIPGLRCESCQTRGNCYQTSTIFSLPDILIIQLALFSYVDANNTEKIIPNMNLDETLSLFGKTLTLHGIIYHSGPNTNSGHYTSAVRLNDTWYTINDERISEGVKLYCVSTDTTVPYILIYKSDSIPYTNSRVEFNCNTRSTIPVKSYIKTAMENSKYSQFESNVSKNSEKKLRESMINEIIIQREKIECIEKRKLNATGKSPVKRKSKFGTNSSSTKRVKDYRNRLHKATTEQIKKTERKRMSNLRDKLDEPSKNKLKENQRKRMSYLRDKLDEPSKKY